jgi:hypothetical protein
VRSPETLLAVLVLSLAAVPQCSPSEQTDYALTLNGQPLRPAHWSLDGEPGQYREGDVVRVAGLALTLGVPGDYRFATDEGNAERNRLWLVRADGGRKLVALRTADSLLALEPAQVSLLRGIRLDAWSDAVAEKLNYIDTSRACITVTYGAAVGEEGALPPLPPDLRYLNVEEGASMMIRDYSHLTELPGLAFLRLDSLTRDHNLDGYQIASAPGLRCLDCSMVRIAAWGSLARLPELRWLDLSWCDWLRNVDIVRGMPELRYLAVSQTGVTDLTPLGGLQDLVYVDADATRVEKLPLTHMPVLCELSVLGAPVSDREGTRFRQVNPHCVLRLRWIDELRRGVGGATRVRVRSGGTCHRRPREERTLFEVTEAGEIDALLDGIQIDEERSDYRCGCCGWPTAEFYRGNEFLASIGFHHGKSLRWAGWPADGHLTEQSGTFLNDWLEQRGVVSP